MSKTRFTPWVVLACIGTLAGCTSGEGGTAGNTDLNIVLPNGCAQDTSSPDCFDIQVVEYTIACDDGDPTPNGPFLDNNAGFDDRVVINGVLEVFDTPQPGRPGRAASGDPWTWGNSLGDIYVAQGFMDLPVTQNCTAQLRARTAPVPGVNPQGEVVCSDTVTFGVEADTVSTVNVLMYCGLSFQAPVAQLDLAGDFSFNVSNFCPDLFVLNCIDTDIDIRPTPLGELAVTACQVRFRDGDSTCGDSCDPQECTTAPEGLRCAPACQADNSCPTEPTTTVTCSGGELGPFPGSIINCDGGGAPSPTGACVFNGDTLGEIGGPAPGPPPVAGGPGPGPGGFFVACVLCDDDYITQTGGQDPRCNPTTGATGLPLAPGATVTCRATTTDGDVDCDKTKVVQLTCPGLTACQTFGGNAACDDGTICTDDICVDATCDGTVANCCNNPPANEGVDCSSENPPLASCQAGSCMSDACSSDADCENPATQCLVAPAGACQADGTCLAEVAGNFGDPCDSGTGSGDGTCGASGTAEAGTCESNDACTTATQIADCGTNANVCLLNQCDQGVTPYACETVDNDGTSCDPGGGLPGICSGGTCIANPPFVNPGTGNTAYRAAPRLCSNGNFPFIDAPRADCALCLSNSCSGGTNALNACVDNTDCPGGLCVAATPGPADCPLDCFTFVCNTPTDFLFPGGGPGGACVYPTGVNNCPFLGCEVVSNTLKNQLAIDTFLFMDVSSTGTPAREVTVQFDVLAVNPGLALAGPLANLVDVNLITNLTDANPSTIVNVLNPALQGTSVDSYTGTGSFVLSSPDQLLPATEVVTPLTFPTVDLAFDEANFIIGLEIKSSGAPLDITGSACTFSNEQGTCFGGLNNGRLCDPAAPDGSTGLSNCLAIDPPIILDPGVCTRTDGAPITLGTTDP